MGVQHNHLLQIKVGCSAAGQLPVLQSVCEGKWVDLYKLWRLMHECNAAQPNLPIPWGVIASSLLGCPAWRQDAAQQIHLMYRTKLMEFDQTLIKQAAAYQAMSQPVPSLQSPHSLHSATQHSLDSTASHAHSQLPAAALLTNGAPLQGPQPGPPRPHVTRGRPKRARSPSSEHVGQHQPSAQAGPLQGRLHQHQHQAHPAVQLQWQQQAQWQPLLMPSALPTGVVPLLPQQAGYPGQVSSTLSASPSKLLAKGPALHHHHQQQQQSLQKSPQQLPLRPMPQGRAGPQGQPKLTSPRAQSAAHVDGMAPEEISAAATAAAAASGYCEPKRSSHFAEGLASLVGTSIQVSLGLRGGFTFPCL